MNRPTAETLTERELEVMHIFWSQGELTAQSARDHLESQGRNLSYTTVANLCRILWEKEFLKRIGDVRPFSFKPSRSFHEVSGHLVSDLIHKVFQGSREQLLLQVIGNQKLSAKKRQLLTQLLDSEEGADPHLTPCADRRDCGIFSANNCAAFRLAAMENFGVGRRLIA